MGVINLGKLGEEKSKPVHRYAKHIDDKKDRLTRLLLLSLGNSIMQLLSLLA